MPEAGHDEVSVYLVGYDEDIVLKTDIDKRLELISIPDPAHRVVRAREDYHPGLPVYRVFEPLNIHPVIAVLTDKGVVEHDPAVIRDDGPEREAHGGREND